VRIPAVTKRTRNTLWIVGTILLLLIGALYLRTVAPPEAARLLPESDGILYADLRPLRLATHFDQKPIQRDPSFQRFIDATGIVFERDLDEVAISLHRMADPHGPNGPVAYSQVYVGKLDAHRLATWLASEATSTEVYDSHTVYSIPSEGRTVRVAILGYDTVALTNTPTPEQIHSILDRYRSAAMPFTGSSLLAEHYRDIPKLPLPPLAWGIGKIGLPLSEGGSDNDQAHGGTIHVFGIELPIHADSTFVAYLRWTGSLNLHIEEQSGSPAEAAVTVSTLNNLLALAQGVSNASPDSKATQQLKTLLDATKVELHHDHAEVTTTLPDAMIKEMMQPTDKQR
jgi:hypothetical protein